MKVLICTVFDIDIPCAGLNRLNHMTKALSPFGIECLISVGSGNIKMSGETWKTFKKDNQEYLLYDKSLFPVLRHCNAMRISGVATKFYSKFLQEIILKLKLSGIIVYSPQSQLIKPLFKICETNEVFIVADCTENFSLSFRHILNGVIYQQFMFRVFQMKKLNGAIISSPRWFLDTEKAHIPASLIPGFLDPKVTYREHENNNSDNFIITIMGRFSGREMPSVLIKAFKICLKRKLKFKVNIIGSGKGGRAERFWLNKLTKSSNNFIIHGYVSNDERDQILASSDIFIMLRPPSKETQYIYPSRISEYLYSGNPVILSNTSALNEFFKQGFGIYFIDKKNDSVELSKLIIDLASNSSARFKIGQKGRQYAENNFSLDVMGIKLSKFLKSMKSHQI